MTDNPNPPARPGPFQRYPQLSRTALAAALVTLALAGPQLEAQAVALGAVSVQSALGEPLRARVELPQLSSEEASSLDARIGSPAAFEAAGVNYVPALAGASVRLQRRPNGTAYLSISGQRPVNEPLVDLVVEADWNGGHVVRNYTMLIDPPRPAPVAAPETVTTPQAAPESAPAPSRARPTAAPATRTQPASAGKRRQATAQAAAPRQRAGQVRVRRGSTASQIAVAGGLRGVSLDQMLLAMLRANPDAFINNNVNLIKAGALLRMPSLEDAKTTSRAEARRIILAQTDDFNAYRSGLAASVSSTQVAAGGQTDQGEVRTAVQDSAEDDAPADRLEITKATDGEGGDDATASVAQSRETLDQSERLAELDRNISELSELTEAQDTDADAAPPTGEQSAGAETDGAEADALSEGEVTAADANDADSAASDAAAFTANEDADAAGTLETASTGTADSGGTDPAGTSGESGTPAGLAAPAGLDTQAQPSWMDLLERYRWPIALVLALLALLGIYSSRRRRSDDDEEEDFFSASRAADFPPAPSEAAVAAAAAVAADRQAQMADPMQAAAEALSAGDEARAEQILEDALRTNPERAPIYQRLAEIHARRGDVKGLASVARRARDRLGTSNAIWTAIAALGTDIDPDNSLYKAHEATVAVPDAGDPLDPSTFWSDTEFGSNSAEPMDVETQQVDQDQPTITMPELPDLELDFAPPAVSEAPIPDPDATPETELMSADELFELKLDDPPTSDGTGQDQAADAKPEHESLPDKLERAQSLVDAGDLDTARKLAADVAKSATGELKTRAEDFLLSLLNR